MPVSGLISLALADVELRTPAKSSVKVVEYTGAHVLDASLMINFLDSQMELVNESLLVDHYSLLHQGVNHAGHNEVRVYVRLHKVQ